MPETVWYYARGEVERGPFTTVQIKALANAGKLRADDLVWKEGMENWTSAAEVTELFSTDHSAIESRTTLGSTTAESISTRNPLLERTAGATSEFGKLVTIGGRACIFVGILCIVLIHGCESLGQRRVARFEGLANLQTVESLPKDGAATASAPENTGRRRFEVTRAQAELSAGAFGRGITLYGGLLFLFLGAAALTSFANGSDRWFGMAIVLIVCFSLLSSALE